MKRITTIFIILLVSFSFLAASTEFSVDKAKRVEKTLKHIAKKRRKSPYLRKITFTQEELNSYLNIFYTKRYAPEVKLIKLKLDKDNHASGEMKILLKGKKYDKVPSFLKDIEVEFSGKVQCGQYRMRYVFDNIKINGSKFSPELLDEAFGAAQLNNRVKKSMFDWFELLPGIKSVVLDHKKITLFY
ncbi:MAG: hypothetical protein GY950_27980 [bacterium]|nr:hypothetical protein [bacterium]